MNKSMLTASFYALTMLVLSSCNGSRHIAQNTDQKNRQDLKKFNVQLILGSTRQGRTSDKIGLSLKAMLDKREDINSEIIDLREFNLDFLNDAIAPAEREIINDPKVKKWSDKIKSADGFIIITPEYNSGYPGVLKNALDLLYKEWNNKPVGFVGYSGGSAGGSNAINQLRQVAQALEMKPVAQEITLPHSWKIFDSSGNLVDSSIEQKLNNMVDELIKAASSKKD